jgi:hypothetical protein
MKPIKMKPMTEAQTQEVIRRERRIRTKMPKLPPLDLRAGMLAVRHIDAQIAGKRPRWPGLTVNGK